MLSRKMILALLGSLMIFIGCGPANQLNNEQTLVVNEEEKSITIAFAHKSINSYFYTIMNEAVKRSVESRGWTFEYSVADYDPKRQNQQIVNFIKQNPDAIITTAIDSIAIEEVIKRGNEAGIPMCTIDTTAKYGQLAVDVSFDNFKAGQLAAETIVNLLKERYGRPQGTVFNGYGELSSNAWRLRKEGFESVISKYPDIEYMPVPTEGQPDQVVDRLRELLDEGVEIDAVHAPSEHPARGLVDALKETGNWYHYWEVGHIIMVTIDAEPYFVNLINQGYSDAAVVQDVIAYGNITVDLLDNYILKGEEVPEGTYYVEDTYWKECEITKNNGQFKVVIPPYVIDADNSNDQLHWAYKAEKLWGFQFNR